MLPIANKYIKETRIKTFDMAKMFLILSLNTIPDMKQNLFWPNYN